MAFFLTLISKSRADTIKTHISQEFVRWGLVLPPSLLFVVPADTPWNVRRQDSWASPDHPMQRSASFMGWFPKIGLLNVFFLLKVYPPSFGCIYTCHHVNDETMLNSTALDLLDKCSPIELTAVTDISIMTVFTRSFYGYIKLNTRNDKHTHMHTHSQYKWWHHNILFIWVIISEYTCVAASSPQIKSRWS